MTSTTSFSLERSTELFRLAQKVIPGGLVSRIRKRDNQPMFTHGAGARVWDVDGNEYIDTVFAHGPVFLGHANPRVNAAVIESIGRATLFGGTTRAESELAERALAQLGYASKATFMTTGTEAVQLAIRTARSTTGRTVIVKFDGHYHGWIDPVFTNIPGWEPKPPASPADGGYSAIDLKPAVGGAPSTEDVLIGRWGDIDHYRGLMELHGDKVAAVIMEPLITGYGTFAPPAGYLDELKRITHQHGALVIFDEVVTGFRIARGGAAEMLEVTPDIGVYAKAIANGFPISMIAGSDEVMACIADGTVPAAGTYSGAPHALAAALATLDITAEAGFYEHLDSIGRRLAAGLSAAGKRIGAPVSANQIGSVVQVLWGDIEDSQTLDGVYRSDLATIAQVMEGMITRGVYTVRKGLFYLSAAHTNDDIDRIIETFESSASAHIARTS